MLKKATLVLLLVGCTLATPTKASAENYSQEAYTYIKMADYFAGTGNWYSAYYFAALGFEYAWDDYLASYDADAYWAAYYADYGSNYAYNAYLYGDTSDKASAVACLDSAYDFAYWRYIYGK
jgi:hypothetical protein